MTSTLIHSTMHKAIPAKVPSFSSFSYVPWGLPNALAVPFTTDPESNHKVQDFRGAETIPADASSRHNDLSVHKSRTSCPRTSWITMSRC